MKLEAVAATKGCSRAMKRLGDLQEAAKVREDGLNKIIHDLEVKADASAENELQLKSTIFDLRKYEGIDWEMAIEADDFAPIRETLFNLTMKSAKESVQAEYPNLKLDFLAVEDEEEVKDTQSGIANLGIEGQKISSTNEEAVGQGPAKVEEGKQKKDGGGEVDIHLLEE